jgi:hypothetical protein
VLQCRNKVSCADILAMATRDAIAWYAITIVTVSSLARTRTKQIQGDSLLACTCIHRSGRRPEQQRRREAAGTLLQPGPAQQDLRHQQALAELQADMIALSGVYGKNKNESLETNSTNSKRMKKETLFERRKQRPIAATPRLQNKRSAPRKSELITGGKMKAKAKAR